MNPSHHRTEKKKQRKFFTQEEINAIFAGVQQFGEGKWTKIKESRADLFGERTTLDLKDKWRNIKKRPASNKEAAGKKKKEKKVGKKETKKKEKEKEKEKADGKKELLKTVEPII
mmetsp:Transcript_14742/g.19060  ORF Transcript_14742/g.19060 Transcript_14742/m.19060 type:complete len:115 (-) Transcript_14742:1181-1525(-)